MKLFTEQYDRVDLLCDNIYRVQKNGAYGILNGLGDVIFPTLYKSIVLLSDAVLRLELNDKFFLSFLNGNIFSQEYYKIEYALNGIYAIYSNKWYFINSQGIYTNMPDNVLLYTSYCDSLIDIEHKIGEPKTTYNSIFHQTPIYTECIQGQCIIIFNNSLKLIGEKAFSHCHNLLEISIPNSVELIDDFAFEYTSLKSISIPNKVRKIGRFSFYGCSNIENIYIPPSVTKIGGYAFNRCGALKQFTGNFSSEDNRCIIIDGKLCAFTIGCGDTEYAIPSNVRTIGAEAFHNCSSLTTISIPEGVTSIEEAAFRGCSNLVSITIPKNVTEIGRYAFAGCRKLKTVFLKSIKPPLAYVWDMFNDDWKAFLGNASERILYVPFDSIEKYKSPYFWKEYSNDIQGYDYNE